MPPQSRATGHSWALLALLLLTFGVYVNGLGGEFLFDDYLLLKPAWEWLSPAQWGWGRPNPEGTAALRPLVTLSFYFDRLLFGQQSPGYHFINVLLHLVNVALVMLLLIRLGLPRWTAWIAAAIFALHPVQTESVTYIAGRRDLLLGLAYLALFLVYLGFRDQPNWRNAAAFAALFFIGLGTKEALAMLPLVLVVAEITLLAPHRTSVTEHEGRRLAALVSRAWAAVSRQWRLLLLASLAGVPLLLHRVFISTHMWDSNASYYLGGSLGTHYFTAAKAQVVLLWRLVFPLHLLADYTTQNPVFSTGWSDPLGWSAVVILGLYVVLMIWSLSHQPRLGFALVVVALGLLPSSQILRHPEVTAEHYLYIPVIGFALLVAALAHKLGQIGSRRWVVSGILIPLLLCLHAVRTVARNVDYSSERAFWSAVARTSPGCARAQVYLGIDALGRGRTAAALRHFQHARNLDPSQDTAFGNEGRVLLHMGRFEEGREALAQAVGLNPKLGEYRMDLAEALLGLGKPQEALDVLGEVQSNDPGNPRLRQLMRRVRGAPDPSGRR